MHIYLEKYTFQLTIKYANYLQRIFYIYKRKGY